METMPPILIVDNYDSFTYNLYQRVQTLADLSEPEPEHGRGKGTQVLVRRNDDLTLEDIYALAPQRIILSPGPGHPQRPGDFGVCADILTHHSDLNCPILGVCLGHQGLVAHFGGRIDRAPEVFHGKTSDIRQVVASPLMAGLPEVFPAMRYHSLVAHDENFPETLRVIAREVDSGLIMGVEHREKPIYGVQFHPESIGTPHGDRLLANFLTF